jgi:3-isopropylmalate/(R)-2-methylmalate dehydratase large subunit
MQVGAPRSLFDKLWDRHAILEMHGCRIPTSGCPVVADPAMVEIVALLARNTDAHDILHLGMDDPRQSIVHVAAPELGIALPGMFLACAGSHVATHGALGVLAHAIGTSGLRHVLLTQAAWE